MKSWNLLIVGLLLVVSSIGHASDDDPTEFRVTISAAGDGSTATAVARWTKVELTAERGGVVSGTYGNGINLCLEDEPGNTCTITPEKYREARSLENQFPESRLGGVIEFTQPVRGVVTFTMQTDDANRGPFRVSYQANGGGRTTRTFTSNSGAPGRRGISSEGIVDVTSSDIRARGEVEIVLNVFASDGSEISDVRWTQAEFEASAASISGMYGDDSRSICSETTPARICTISDMDFPTLTDNARVLNPDTNLGGSIRFTPPITGTVSFGIGASSADHLIVRRDVAGLVTATASQIERDVEPPMIDSAGPSYGEGRRLWLTFNESIKVLQSASAPADAESLGEETLLTGFTVEALRDGNDMSDPIMIRIDRAYYSTPGVVLELRDEIEAGDSIRVSYSYEGGAGIYDTAVERGVVTLTPGARNQMMAQTNVYLPSDSSSDRDGDGIPDAAEARLRGNPLLALTTAELSEIPQVELSRGVASTSTIAYSGIRAHGLGHLGVTVTATGVQPTAYYLSDTFGRSVGNYRCATGIFPANYRANIADGGCAVVDFGNMPAGVVHRIGWLVQRDQDSYWRPVTDTASRLPEQRVWRVPELNMVSERLFFTVSDTDAAMVSVAAVHDGDAPTAASLTLDFSNVENDPTTTGNTFVAEIRKGDISSDTSQMSYAITALRSGLVTEDIIWRPGDGLASLTMSSYSLGVVTQTTVVLLDEGASLPTLRPRPAATGDNTDGDGIPDNEDNYPNDDGLPVIVVAGADSGGDGWHHIRPVLPVHELHVGMRTREHVSATRAMSMPGVALGYNTHSASDTREPGFDVVYSFEIYNVAYAANTRTVMGGVAGVIIPLPESLRERTDLLPFKLPAGRPSEERPFVVSDAGDGYGFARLRNGTCPNDLSDSSPYRDENGDLRSAKRRDDACMVLYIVDGGPNDEDREVNGAVLDPLGLKGTFGGGGGGGSYGLIGTFALLLILAMLLLRRRRRSVSSTA